MAKKPRKDNPMPSAGPEAKARSLELRVALAPGQSLRADRYLSEVAAILSRSQLKARSATLILNGKAAKLSALLKGGETLVLSWLEEAPEDLVPEDLLLSVLYEDERVVVVDKAQGMVTHPGHGNPRGTLANALLGRYAASSASTPGPVPRAGIVHRLDKDTSGVLIAAKDAEAQAFLAAQFKDRTTRKEYLAITCGLPNPPTGRIENRLGRDPRNRQRFAVTGPAEGEGGKLAVTDYRILRSWGGYALVGLRPKTGRTHQLRVHLAFLGCPILGDPIYGRTDSLMPEASLMLHAWKLRLALPGQGPRLFKARLPSRFRRVMRFLDGRFRAGE